MGDGCGDGRVDRGGGARGLVGDSREDSGLRPEHHRIGDLLRLRVKPIARLDDRFRLDMPAENALAGFRIGLADGADDGVGELKIQRRDKQCCGGCQAHALV